MKKYTILLITVIVLSSPAASWSQINQPTNNRISAFNLEGNLAANNIMRSRDVLQEVINQGKSNEIRIDEIEGEPYLDKKYTMASLMYKDSAEIGEYLMRYNAYADEMEISNPDGLGYLNKADFIKVHLNEDIYIPLNYYANKGEIKKGFFIEKLVDKKCSLYLRKYKTVKEGMQAKTSFHKATPAQFIDHESYFLKFGNKAPVAIKLKKNQILKSFSHHVDELKAYVNNEDMTLDSEKQLMQLITYYNAID